MLYIERRPSQYCELSSMVIKCVTDIPGLFCECGGFVNTWRKF